MHPSGFAKQIIWQLQGQQGSQWKQGQAPIPNTGNSYRVVFEGVRGTDYSGDIAIDDITFTESNCGGEDGIN